MIASPVPTILLLLLLVLSCKAYREVGLSYYQLPRNQGGYIGYGGTVCALKADISFLNISNIDPELSCKETQFCHPFGGCQGKQVDCHVRSNYANPVTCEKVKRVCEVSLQGELSYGTCKYVDLPPGNCCYHLEDSFTGLWSTYSKGSKCPFLCFGVISLPGAEWCKTCTCVNSDRGTGQGGSRSYSSLC